jgi:hypothetical protein
MLHRQVEKDNKGNKNEIFDIAGSTGNIYQVTIGRSPSCTCPDSRFHGAKCKHINYALIIILKAPVYLQYQLAFLSEELESIFANAPVTQDPVLVHGNAHEEVEKAYNGTRKPAEGDCPICVFEMKDDEDLVW